MPKMDYSKLLGRIKENGHTPKSVAEAIGISESQFCQKLAGNYPFKQSDIQRLCDLLGIGAADIGSYFSPPFVDEPQLPAFKIIHRYRKEPPIKNRRTLAAPDGRRSETLTHNQASLFAFYSLKR